MGAVEQDTYTHDWLDSQNKRPSCDVCGEEITEAKYWEIDRRIYCEECLGEAMDDLRRLCYRAIQSDPNEEVLEALLDEIFETADLNNLERSSDLYND